MIGTSQWLELIQLVFVTPIFLGIVNLVTRNIF